MFFNLITRVLCHFSLIQINGSLWNRTKNLVSVSYTHLDVYKRQLLSSGFEKVEYIGAFGTDDNWLDSWTNFDPNNTDY